MPMISLSASLRWARAALLCVAATLCASAYAQDDAPVVDAPAADAPAADAPATAADAPAADAPATAADAPATAADAPATAADAPADAPAADAPAADAPLPDAPAVLAPPTSPPDAVMAPPPVGERMAYGGFQATPLAPPTPFSDMEIAGLSVLLAGGLTTVTGALLWAQGFDIAGPITTGIGAATSTTGATLLFVDSLDRRPAPLEQPAEPDVATQSTFWLGFSGSF
jgi:hypothetical protein